MKEQELHEAFDNLKLRTGGSEVVGVFFKTDPQLGREEAKELFQGIYPSFNGGMVVSIPAKTRQLNLGNRGCCDWG